MPVYDRSYRRWDGQLSRRSQRFLPIAATGIRQSLTYRGGWFLRLLYRALLFVSLIPTLIFLFLNYVANYRPSFAQGGMLNWLDSLQAVRTLQYPFLLRLNLVFLMAFTVIVGSGLIARDRSAGAMPLYLSRPVTRLDYALGKFCVLAWFLGGLTVIPCLLLWTFGVVSSPREDAFRTMLPELPRILLHCGVIVLTYSTTMLAVSALFRRPMFAGLVWFATIVFLPSFLSIAGRGLEWYAVPAISPNDSFHAIAFEIWDLGTITNQAGVPNDVRQLLQMLNVFPETPVEWCWISVTSWTLLSLLILWRVLRREDVVTDAAR